MQAFPTSPVATWRLFALVIRRSILADRFFATEEQVGKMETSTQWPQLQGKPFFFDPLSLCQINNEEGPISSGRAQFRFMDEI